jgi:2'-5' RNA ligase
MVDTIRAFIAFELPERITSLIRGVQESIKGYKFKIKWVQPKNIHLTLKFLGNIPPSDTEKIGDAIIESVRKFKPISLSVKGIGVFPDLKRPRVLWVGITGGKNSLTGLHQALEENLESIGFPKESRPFKRHLTLGRIKGRIDSKRLVYVMEEFIGFESETFEANKIILFQSEQTPSGAVYSKLANVKL